MVTGTMQAPHIPVASAMIEFSQANSPHRFSGLYVDACRPASALYICSESWRVSLRLALLCQWIGLGESQDHLAQYLALRDRQAEEGGKNFALLIADAFVPLLLLAAD